MFNDPNLLGKIAGNPQTKHLVADPTFMSKLQKVQQNPKLLQQEIMQDPNFMNVMAMLLGINMNAPGGPQSMETDEPVVLPPPPSPIFPFTLQIPNSTQRNFKW